MRLLLITFALLGSLSLIDGTGLAQEGMAEITKVYVPAKPVIVRGSETEASVLEKPYGKALWSMWRFFRAKNWEEVSGLFAPVSGKRLAEAREAFEGRDKQSTFLGVYGSFIEAKDERGEILAAQIILTGVDEKPHELPSLISKFDMEDAPFPPDAIRYTLEFWRKIDGDWKMVELELDTSELGQVLNRTRRADLPKLVGRKFPSSATDLFK